MAVTRSESWERRLTRTSFFLGAVLFHLLLFLMVATLVIWKAPAPPVETSFQRISVKIPPPPVQPPSESAAANNPDLEPQPVVVPVVTPPSVITSVNSSFSLDTKKIMSEALSHISNQMAQGSGLESGGGGLASGSGSVYGSANGASQVFTGYFYDLKQTPDRKPTDIAEDSFEAATAEENCEPNFMQSVPSQNHIRLLREFAKTWNMSLLDDYYKAPDPLYARQIAIPVTASSEATKAFHVSEIVRARRWLIIYSAKIVPPQTGRYRFIGFGDDFMVVRINGQNVLDASLSGTDAEELDPSANTNEDVGMGPEGGTLKCGTWIDAQAGISMDMQVLIGEGPGGKSGFVLMVEKEGESYPKGDYPVFQLQDGDVPDIGEGFSFSKKKMLFQVPK